MFLAALAASVVPPSIAQPVVQGVVNAASYSGALEEHSTFRPPGQHRVEIESDNAEDFKQGAKIGKASVSRR